MKIAYDCESLQVVLKVLMPLGFMLIPASPLLADGLPVDQDTKKLTCDHTLLQLSDSQREEIEVLSTLTLSSEQWDALRKVGSRCPKRIDVIFPVTLNDNVGETDMYAIQMSPNQVAVPHHLIQNPDPEEASSRYGRDRYGLDYLRVDRRGQFYLSGVLVPFPELLEMVDHAKRPRCERPAQGAGVVVEIPMGMTSDSPVVKSRIDQLNARAQQVANTVHKLAGYGPQPVYPWDTGVAAISERAFNHCVTPEDITLPDKISDIGMYAFANCPKLRSVRLPSELAEIGISVFSDCAELSTVRISDTVTRIGDRAFNGCAKLQLSRFPASLVSVGDAAFEGCTAITALELPAKLSHLGIGALASTSLESIVIPPTVKYLGAGAFGRCESLNRVDIKADLAVIDEVTFISCAKLRLINLPDSVTEIKRGAFLGCHSLAEIKLPSSLARIGNSAFGDCSSIEQLFIPERVTDIGDESFCDCKSLRSITLPKGLKTIGKRAFAQCRALESIVIPEGVETIEPGTFANCDALKTVTLLNANTKISPYAFNVDFKVEIVRPAS